MWACMDFRILGIPVRVQPVFLVITVVLALSRLSTPILLVSWIAVVFASVLLHELGHAMAFRALGHSSSIELHAMGGHTRAVAAMSPKQDVFVSLAGPAVGLLLGGAIYLLSVVSPELRSIPHLGVVIADLLWVNIGWGVLNLLPILPLDGGRVLIAALRHWNPQQATLLAHRISMITAGIGAAIALQYGMMVAVLMAGLFAADNYRAQSTMRR